MVARRPVGRPPVGDVRKHESATALRAYVAARLEGRSDEDYLRELRLDVSLRAVHRAASKHRQRPRTHRKRRPQPGQAEREHPFAQPAIRNWVAVDAQALGLGAALISIPTPTSQAQRGVYRSVGAVLGVVQLIACGSGTDRRIVALVLTDGEDDRRRLRAELDEFADEWHWEEIDLETVEPAVQTWRRLAQQAAQRERLRI